MQRVFSLKWTTAHTFQEFDRNQVRERMFQEISASTDASYNSKEKKKKKEREKIVYFNNTSYIFVLNWWLGITIEQSWVISCPVVLSLSLSFLNFKFACQCFSIQCTQCELQHLKCLAGHSCSWHHMLGRQGGHCRAGLGQRQHQCGHWDVPTKECVTASCAA